MSGKATPGPWSVWSGPDYVGGGADLCIGAGETWLANMDHRNCVNREQHLCGGTFEPCRREGDTDICSTSGCRCGGECPEANHISEEQMANARLISAAPDLLEACKGVYDEHEHDHAPRQCFVCDKLAAAIAKAEGL